MPQEIERTINELKEYVDKQRELIVGINNAIQNDGFVPSESQKLIIDYICQQGKNGLKEIERLEGLKNKF